MFVGVLDPLLLHQSNSAAPVPRRVRPLAVDTLRGPVLPSGACRVAPVVLGVSAEAAFLLLGACPCPMPVGVALEALGDLELSAVWFAVKYLRIDNQSLLAQRLGIGHLLYLQYQGPIWPVSLSWQLRLAAGHRDFVHFLDCLLKLILQPSLDEAPGDGLCYYRVCLVGDLRLRAKHLLDPFWVPGICRRVTHEGNRHVAAGEASNCHHVRALQGCIDLRDDLSRG